MDSCAWPLPTRMHETSVMSYPLWNLYILLMTSKPWSTTACKWAGVKALISSAIAHRQLATSL